MIQGTSQNYSVSNASTSNSVSIPYIQITFPLSSTNNFPLGKRWINQNTNTVYSLTNQINNPILKIATFFWTILGSGFGFLKGFNPNSGTSPVESNTGDINLTAGSANLRVVGSTSQVSIRMISTPVVNTVELNGSSGKLNYLDVSSSTSFVGTSGPLVDGQVTVVTSACKSDSYILVSPPAVPFNITNGQFSIGIGTAIPYPAGIVFNYLIINKS
jgi:hypothetical protein